MSKHEQRQEQIQQTAAQFVTRLYSGELSGHEERQLQKWRNEHRDHEQALQTMLALWDLSSHLYQPVAQKRTFRRRLRSWGLSAAAGVVLSAGVLYLANIEKPAADYPSTVSIVAQTNVNETATQQSATKQLTATTGKPEAVRQEHRYLRTGTGEVDTIALSDGSIVTLNTKTTLQVAFNDAERYVVLVEGEAFFDVESDVQRPFVIDTGEQEIRVLGTKFNVRKEESGVRVAVVEGKVAVTRVSSIPSANSMNDNYPASFDAEDYLLEAGAIGSFSTTADVVASTNFAQVSEAQNWRRGIFRFDDSSLAEVVKEFNRYRSHKIHLVNEETGNLRISGVFHFNDGEGLLQALSASLPIEFEEVGNDVFIRKTL